MKNRGKIAWRGKSDVSAFLHPKMDVFGSQDRFVHLVDTKPEYFQASTFRNCFGVGLKPEKGVQFGVDFLPENGIHIRFSTCHWRQQGQ